MRAVIARSTAVDSVTAAAELLMQATEQLGAEQPVAAFLFASPDYEHQVLLDALADRWPGLPLVGGSTDGELSSVGGFAHDSVALTLLCGEGLSARVGLGRNLSKDPAAAVAQVLADCGDRQPALCWTIFAPSSDAAAVVRRLQAGIGEATPIIGGLTGDHHEYSRMVEFCGREVLKDSLPVLMLDGELKISFGIGTGWFPIGEPVQATRVDGHILHEIGGRPALELYRDYWGEAPAEQSLGEYPIAVYPNGPNGDFYLRAVLACDAATGAVRLAGAVPEGAWLRLTEVVPEGVLAGSEHSASAAVKAFPGATPEIAFVFSCAARKWVLGTKAEGESAILAGAFASAGVKPSFVGGYCFGEIAPQRIGAPSEFHNETCVTVLLGR